MCNSDAHVMQILLENLKLRLIQKPRIRRLSQAHEKEIFDIVRRQYVALTPEEWVRQNLIHTLLLYGYSRTRIQVERGLKQRQNQRRADVIAYDELGKPFLLVECKASTVPLDEATFTQAFAYNQQVKAPYIGLTNGVQHYFFKQNEDHYKKLVYLPIPTFQP